VAAVLVQVAAQVEKEFRGGMTAGGEAGDRQLGVGQGQAQLKAVRSACKKEKKKVMFKRLMVFF
jgi:hypothetical protein